jgi:hypothetical protein
MGVIIALAAGVLLWGCAPPAIHLVPVPGQSLSRILCEPCLPEDGTGELHQYVVPYGEVRDKKVTFTGVLVDLSLAVPIGIRQGERLLFRVDGRQIVLDRRMRIETEDGAAEVAVFAAAPEVFKAIGRGRQVTCLLAGRDGTLEKTFTDRHILLFRAFSDRTGSGTLVDAPAAPASPFASLLKMLKPPSGLPK